MKPSEQIDQDKRREFGGRFVSQDWYRNKMFEVLANQPQENQTHFLDTYGLDIGKFYYFTYSARYPNRYPYWDRFPLAQILKINTQKGTILGANVHYLNPAYRGQVAKNWINSLNSIPEICLHTYIISGIEGISKVPNNDVEGLSKYIVELFVDERGQRVVPNRVWSGNK